nr:hypothetical protein [uncultured Oscillibacter sp.]
MRAERLFRVLGLTDPALVEEALETRARRVEWKRWAALAACLALVIGLGFGWLVTGGFRGYGMSGGDSGSAGASGDAPADGAPIGPGADPGEPGGGGSGAEDGTVFMSYAGPVLPLTTAEDPAGLTAERELTWDFARETNGYRESRQWGAGVTDAYILRNPTEADVTVTALYPFAGRFADLAEELPAVTVDGEAVETALYAGAYAGGFESTFGAEPPDTMNLMELTSWRGYKALLESGTYQAQALGDGPALDMPVTVYEFSDFSAPHEQYPAATQAVSFEIDEDATKILTYGFNGCEQDEGFRRYSYFVPDGKRHEPKVKLLIVLGEDVGTYTLQGYQDGGCYPGEEIEGVSCTVTRRTAALDAVLELVCRDCMEGYDIYGEGWVTEDGPVTFGMYRRAAAELLSQYGALSGASMDRYADGRLDDMVMETLWQDRVLYLAFPVTAPAGGSVEVECSLWKEPSFDFACSGSENAGLQGYDLTTRLGSSLDFTRQRAALVNTENVEITGQDFGFDLEAGVTAVELDLEREHYYLEIRPITE